MFLNEINLAHSHKQNDELMISDLMWPQCTKHCRPDTLLLGLSVFLTCSVGGLVLVLAYRAANGSGPVYIQVYIQDKVKSLSFSIISKML